MSRPSVMNHEPPIEPPDPVWTDECCICGEVFYKNEDNGIEVVFLRNGKPVDNPEGAWIVCDDCLKFSGVEVKDGRLIVLDPA